MRLTGTLASIFVLSLGCASSSPNRGDVPIASALVLHLCEAAEANALLVHDSKDPGPISKTTVQLEREAKLVPAGETFSVGEWDGHKTVTVEADGLPTLEQCRALGYLQHGPEPRDKWPATPPVRPPAPKS